MEPSQPQNPKTKVRHNKENSDKRADITEADILNDEVKQAEFRKAYLEQLRRMSCPGCGEDPTLPF